MKFNISDLVQRDAELVRGVHAFLRGGGYEREAAILKAGVNLSLKPSTLLNLRFVDFNIVRARKAPTIIQVDGDKAVKAAAPYIQIDGIKIEAVNQSVLEVYRQRYGLYPSAAYLFENTRQRPEVAAVVSRQSVSKVLRRSVEFPISLEDMRKVWARRALAEGCSLSRLKAHFNHRSKATTIEYLDLANCEGFADKCAQSCAVDSLIIVSPLLSSATSKEANK